MADAIAVLSLWMVVIPLEPVQETTESKLDQVNNLLAPVTATPQEQGKTDLPPEPSSSTAPDVTDDFFD